jgi:endonuclease YncB( thermonuclease family)
MYEYIRNNQASILAARSAISRVFREIVRALARLPVLAKFFIGLAILVEFLVVTQWERLTFKTTPPPASPPTSLTSQPPVASIPAPQADTIQADEARAKRLVAFEIVDPQVQGNGSIIGNGQVLYLHGIKRFDSKNLCTKASGERWACGLHAYATLRNTLSKNTIACNPKTLLPNAVSATCRIGTTNVALSLVRDGLVELDDNTDDADLAYAQAFAKNGKLGIWDR